MSETKSWLVPNWPAPSCVKALTTMHQGGNLANDIGDNPTAVAANRKRLREAACLPAEPYWLKQVHGIEVINLECDSRLQSQVPLEADASVAFSPNKICVVSTADCLPILLCDRNGSQIAAIHAGWRGLAAGIIEATVQKLTAKSSDLLVWFGPAIGPTAFEVRQDVLLAFKSQSFTAAFQKKSKETWLADLYQLATQRLNALGISSIFGGGFCTYSDKRFYSFRRSKQTGGQEGRQVTMIWLMPS